MGPVLPLRSPGRTDHKLCRGQARARRRLSPGVFWVIRCDLPRVIYRYSFLPGTEGWMIWALGLY